MEPLSKIFESLKKSSNSNEAQSKLESKSVLTKKQTTIKNDRLKRVTEALNAKKEENKTIKNESKNMDSLKRHISLSRKFESSNKKSLRKTRIESKLRDSSESEWNRSDLKREGDFKSDKLRRECGLRRECDLRKEYNHVSDEDNDFDEFLSRKLDSKRRESARRCLNRSEVSDYENRRTRNCNRRCKEDIDSDIDLAEKRFINNLYDGSRRSESFRRKFRR